MKQQTCGNCKWANEFDGQEWATCEQITRATNKERRKFKNPSGFNAVGFGDIDCAFKPSRYDYKIRKTKQTCKNCEHAKVWRSLIICDLTYAQKTFLGKVVNEKCRFSPSKFKSREGK